MAGPDANLLSAAAWAPAGAYAVGVSGGADSVALLHLLHHHRPELRLHVAHLDHQTRGEASTGDAEFVRELARSWGIEHTIAKLAEIEGALTHRPSNRSALFRACRIELFRQVIEANRLDGVLLAHHAADQAETVLQRLLRGSGAAGMAGMGRESSVGGVRILRPLLLSSPGALREYLRAARQTWREDASNASDKYLRNRLRRLIASNPEMSRALLEMGGACRRLRDWVRQAAPELPEAFGVSMLRGVPSILAAQSARRWLVARGAPAEEVGPDVVAQFLNMAEDAASSPRRHFPGGVLVRRRGGRMFVE